MVWITPFVLGIPLLYYFSNPDKEIHNFHPDWEFIRQTEDLIAELSKDIEVEKKTGFQPYEYNQSVPQPSITKLESPSPQESRDDVLHLCCHLIN